MIKTVIAGKMNKLKNIYFRLRNKYTLFLKTRYTTRIIRWLGLNGRLEIRYHRLMLKDVEFAAHYYLRNCRRMQELNYKWGFVKRPE